MKWTQKLSLKKEPRNHMDQYMQRTQGGNDGMRRPLLCEDGIVLGRQGLIEDDLEVSGCDFLEVLGTDITGVLVRDSIVKDADRSIHARAVHGIADRSCIGEEWHLHAALDILLENLACLIGHLVIQVAGDDLGDLVKLVDLVIWEIDVITDTRRHARDEREKLVHAVFVAREHDDQVLSVVLHKSQEDLNGLLAVIAVVRCIVEVVGLVDEEHTAECLLNDLLGLRRCVADILAYEIITSGDHNMPGPAVAHLCQDLAHAYGDCCLACTRRPCEAHVERWHGGVESELAAHLIENQKSGDLADTLLDRDKAD